MKPRITPVRVVVLAVLLGAFGCAAPQDEDVESGTDAFSTWGKDEKKNCKKVPFVCQADGTWKLQGSVDGKVKPTMSTIGIRVCYRDGKALPTGATVGGKEVCDEPEE